VVFEGWQCRSCTESKRDALCWSLFLMGQ
jgi:hypothetical protein